LGIDDQVFTVLYVNLLRAAFSCALLYVKQIYIKETSDKRNKPKMQQ